MRVNPDDTGSLPYFPARLGTPAPREKPGQEDGRITPGHYDAWRESFAVDIQSWSERPEVGAFAELRRGATGFQVILGEPGAGKTRLLEEWYGRWWEEAPRLATFGMRVPALVRLRRLEAPDAGLSNAAFADRLWALAELEAGALPRDQADLYRPERARLFRPVWLLDGLDELSPAAPLSDWLRAFATLPGEAVATCRTAVWQDGRAASSGTRPLRVETIMPLRTDADRAVFLRPALGDDADRLAALLGRHAPLSLLAGNPLLLDLAAMLWRENPGLLPASRAEFYRCAVAALWQRRAPEALRDRTGDRDCVLERLAAQMGLKAEIRKRVLENCAREVSPTGPDELIKGLRTCGLLVDGRHELVSFPHLTFQEYFLSASLAEAGAVAAVERYWYDPRYEEVLALLLAQLVADDRAEEAAAALSWLVRRSAELAVDAGERHRIGRSPLRVALHLASRSGLTAAALRDGWRALDAGVGRASLRVHAVARDQHTPAAVLERLGRDLDDEVRWLVALNPSTPVAVLERLAGDTDMRVRQAVLRHPSTPAATLERLTGDPNVLIQRTVIRYSSGPAEVLEWPAVDPDGEVRLAAAENPSTSPETLERLAGDPVDWVRRAVAWNRSTPPAALERLVGDSKNMVRRKAALNPSTPTAVLERLAGDSKDIVRQAAAENPSMLAAALERLANDPIDEVRQAVARNPSTPVAVLERLAGDPNETVRREAAYNPSTPAALLERLASDLHSLVRMSAACNPSTPAASLERLARDPDREIRRMAARQSFMPTVVLEQLTGDPDHEVRRAAAGNPNTLLESLPDNQTGKPNSSTRSGVL